MSFYFHSLHAIFDRMPFTGNTLCFQSYDSYPAITNSFPYHPLPVIRTVLLPTSSSKRSTSSLSRSRVIVKAVHVSVVFVIVDIVDVVIVVAVGAAVITIPVTTTVIIRV